MQHAPKLYLAPGDGAGYMDHHKMNSKDKHRHNVLPWAPGAASRMGLCSNPPECKTNAILVPRRTTNHELRLGLYIFF